MATYDEYEVDQIARAKKQAAEYEASRRVQADKAAENVKKVYDTAIDTAEKNYNVSAQETENAYREVYDANAINELVARKQAEEAIRNMNLASSGLSRTEQTAISLQRGRADTETTRQKQAAVDSIMRELDALRTQYQQQAASEQSTIYADVDADILNNTATLEAAARQNAATMYAADQEAVAAAATDVGEASTLDQITKLMNAGDGMSFDQAYKIVTGMDYGAYTANAEYEAAKSNRGGPQEWTAPVTMANGKAVSGQDAVMYRVGAGAKQMWDRGGFGDPATQDTTQSARNAAALKSYLQTYVDRGYISENEMYVLIETITYGEDVYELF